MAIPTELVGSLPRPMKLQEAYEAYDQGTISWADLQAEQDAAAEDSIRRLVKVGISLVKLWWWLRVRRVVGTPSRLPEPLPAGAPRPVCQTRSA